MDTVEQLHQFQHFNFEARFFADFTGNALDQRLAYFKHASGQGPVAFHGLAAAPDEQYPSILHNYRAHAHQRRLRKLSLHELTIVGYTVRTASGDCARIRTAATIINKEACLGTGALNYGRSYVANRWNALRIVCSPGEPGACRNSGS